MQLGRQYKNLKTKCLKNSSLKYIFNDIAFGEMCEFYFSPALFIFTEEPQFRFDFHLLFLLSLSAVFFFFFNLIRCSIKVGQYSKKIFSDT